MKALALSLLLLCPGGFAAAQAGAPPEQGATPQARRAAITAERNRLEAGFLAEDAACYRKFAVNRCLDEVNVRRRQAMADLRRQEVLLNDEERKAKGEQQLRRTAQKSSPEKLQEEADRRARAVQEYQGRLAREKGKPGAPGATVSAEKAARDKADARLLAQQRKLQARREKEARAGEQAQRFNERQQEARQRRARHEADKLGQDKPAGQPLPLPQ